MIYDKKSGADIATVYGSFPDETSGLQVWEQDGTFGLCHISDETRAVIDEYLDGDDWDLDVRLMDGEEDQDKESY
jgi:hypothetical protein